MAKSKAKKNSPSGAKMATGGKSKKQSTVTVKVQQANPSSSRSLLRGSIPRPRMRVTGDSECMRVSGLEVISDLLVSDVAITSKFDLNPTLNFLFPRLSGLAGQFERYRFNKVRLNFHTACPATRSGAVGLMLSTEFLDSSSIPANFLDLAAFEHSCVGTVAESLSTPWWIPKGDQKWFIPTSSIANSDPLVVYQGSIGLLTRDAVVADKGLIGGYVSIEYDIDLYGWRPTRNKCLALVNSGQTTTTPAGAAAIIDVNAGRNHTGILNQVGNWAIEKASDYIAGLTGIDLKSYLIGDLPTGQQYQLSYNTTVQAVGVTASHLTTARPALDAWVVEPPDLKKGSRKGVKVDSGERLRYYNPDIVVNPPSYAVPVDADEKGQVVEVPRLGSGSTGDFVISLYLYNSDNQTQVLAFGDTFMLGTAMQTVEGTQIINPPAGYDAAYWQLKCPFSTDVRSILPGGFNCGIVGFGAGA